MPGLPYVIQETHQNTTRNKHTRATVSSENLKNSNLVRKVSWDHQCHTDLWGFRKFQWQNPLPAFPQSKIRLVPNFEIKTVTRNAKTTQFVVKLSFIKNRKKNRAGIKNNATQHEHIPSSKMLNEVNTMKNPPESEKLEC